MQWTLSGTKPLGADQWKITQGNDLLTIWTAGLLCESGVADGRCRRSDLLRDKLIEKAHLFVTTA